MSSLRARRIGVVAGALAVALAAGCSLATTIPDLTSGAGSDAGDAGDAVPPLDASDGARPCHLHTFTYDPKGRQLLTVHVAGSFNGWPQTIAKGGWALAKNADIWTLTHDVPAGHSLYKLVLNESEWITDPSNTKSESDGFGGQNSVLDVTCDDR